jgi:hypothetical protein
MKYSNEKIDEAKKLRSVGNSHNEIAKALSISRMCSIRWMKMGYKRGYKKEGSNIKDKHPKEALDNVNNLNNQNNESGNIDKEGDEGNENNSNEEDKTFKGINVTFATDGGLILEESKEVKIIEGIEPTKEVKIPKEVKTLKETKLPEEVKETEEVKVTDKVKIPEAFKDIDFLGLLLPAAALAAGLLMKKEDNSSNAFRANIERNSW